LDTVVDHIEHIANVAGIDHVGLGTDFVKEYYVETAPDMLDVEFDGMLITDEIEGLVTPEDMPNLTEAMERRGLAEADIRKVLGENLLRVFREVMGVPGAA
jgi:membrane dipeptidase